MSQPVRSHHIVAIISLGILVAASALGNAEWLVVALIGLAYAGLRRQRSSRSTIMATTVEDDFDQYLTKHPVMLSSSRHATSTAGAPVMTRAAQRERTVPDGPREDLGDGVGYELAIVGESHYMAELRALGDRRTDAHTPLEFVATLLREPTNPYDPNAIVVLSDRGNVIGYLSREDAVDYGPVLLAVEAEKKTAQCRAKLLGGTPEKPNIGVWLDIDPPQQLLARISAS